jgi:sugar lactone lactonase YvrE
MMFLRLSPKLLALVLAPAAVVRAELVASFEGQVNYLWDEKHVEAEYLDSKKFTPPTNVITGIKIKHGVAKKPEATTVFLTVPRWFGGVPSTLNKITLDLTQEETVMNPKLEPFPSWDMQEVGNCDKLQFVQSMEIDNKGHMWVIDTGRVDIFTDNPVNKCPPKLMVLDTKTGKLVDEPYIFPEDVAPYDSVFLNDIVVDNVKNVAYISDMSGTDAVTKTTGALIVYDRNKRTSSRFYHESMASELGLSWKFMGRDLGVDAFAQPINGIGLTPSGSRVLYTALQGLTLYSVDAASILSNSADWASTIINHGKRQGSTDGMTVDCKGTLYYSDENEATVYKWDLASDSVPEESGTVVAQDTENMWWTDTYAWDDAGHLWTTADHLPAVFVDGAFLRANIYRFETGTGSYQMGSCTGSKAAKKAKGGKTAK